MNYLVEGTPVQTGICIIHICTGQCDCNGKCVSKTCNSNQNTVCSTHCWGHAGHQPWSIEG